MEKNIKKIEGTVQEITKDSIKIQNYWIKFFDTKELTDIKQGDNISVSYLDNTKNGRTYHNGKSILKYEPKETKLTNNELDVRITDTILMVSSDIYKVLSNTDLQLVLSGKKQASDLNHIDYSEIVKEVLEGLKAIQS